MLYVARASISLGREWGRAAVKLTRIHFWDSSSPQVIAELAIVIIIRNLGNLEDAT